MGRTVVLALEGAAPPLLDRWHAALPTWTALLRAGFSGRFESLPVPYELPALVTAFTGAPPGEHGTFSLWRIHGARFGDDPAITESADVSADFLWERVRPKARTAVVNVPGSHPPREGSRPYLITYPLLPTLHGCVPPDLLRSLVRRGIPYTHDVSALYRGEPRDEFLEVVLHVERARAAATLELLETGPDLAIFCLTIIDRLSHFFWHEVEPGSGMPDEDSALFAAYRFVDDYLKRLLDRLDPADHVFLFSEIGFGPLTRYVSINDILERAGFGSAAAPERAVALEAVQGSHGVNLNLRRRHPEGLIPEEQEERIVEEVREALLQAEIPETGEPLLSAVHRGSELYPGRFSERAPDLVVEPRDERFQPLGDPRWASRVHRHLQTGWHRRTTIWAAHGPLFPASGSGPTLRPEDVAPTLAHLCDVLELETGAGRSLFATGTESNWREARA